MEEGKATKQIMFTVNGRGVVVEVDPTKPLLWVLREDLGLTGTKYSCGKAQCGCCTVLVNGEAVRSCVMPIASAEDRRVLTVEGLSPDNSHPVQRAWIAEQVPQCGYCQPGQMMSATCLLANKPNPSDEDINRAMGGNLCRCGTYPRIRKAIHRAAEIARSEGGGVNKSGGQKS